MKQCYGYIRVSTIKQGQKGVSLQEQREAILRYASKNDIEIASWFEEQETAAKRGRPVFNRMLKLLRQAKARGVVLHKIDRGARNLKDWADLGELSDAGIEIHLANESLDMHSRGGRLSADIQAVVAADYIRNLREETLKGFYGRLKQGFYPLPAPIGYLDKGAAKAKELDPVKAPLVRKAFELYGSGRYNLDRLREELHRLGLRNHRGGKVSRGGLSVLLNSPFYTGIIRLKRTGETFSGAHPPLIAKSLFDRVQAILTGRTNARPVKHDFLFRRLIRCRGCGYSLIGERQKGHHYYRCHTPHCPVTGIREDAAEAAIQAQLKPLCFNEEERNYFRTKIVQLKADWANRQEDARKASNLRQKQILDRLNRLTDAFLDGAIERDLFDQRKTALLMEKAGLDEHATNQHDHLQALPNRLEEFLELAGSAWLSYAMGIPEEKRDLIKIVTSNREVDGKNVVVELSSPYNEVANRFKNSYGPPHRDIPRTWDRLFATLTDLILQGKMPEFHTRKATEV